MTTSLWRSNSFIRSFKAFISSKEKKGWSSNAVRDAGGGREGSAGSSSDLFPRIEDEPMSSKNGSCEKEILTFRGPTRGIPSAPLGLEGSGGDHGHVKDNAINPLHRIFQPIKLLSQGTIAKKEFQILSLKRGEKGFAEEDRLHISLESTVGRISNELLSEVESGSNILIIITRTESRQRR
jgi:hypothetical protein